MERQVLFWGVRDEQGDLEICFPDSGWAMVPEKKFWQGITSRIERCLKTGSPCRKEDKLPVEEAVESIKSVLRTGKK